MSPKKIVGSRSLFRIGGGIGRLRRISLDPGSPSFIVIAIVGVIILAAAIGGSVFMFSLRSYERVQVPVLENEELVSALLRLQERKLNPFVRLRHTNDPTLKGKVLDQRPPAGAVVRIGRQVEITVSQGTVVERIADWTGQDISEVRRDLANLFAGRQALIGIGDIAYIFDDEPSGTVLQQDPAAGTEITGAIELDLVVSRGIDITRFEMPLIVGEDYRDAIELFVENDVPFIFEVGRFASQDGGIIAIQSPEAGTRIQTDATVILRMNPPDDLPEGTLFGIFEQVLSIYPVFVEITLEALSPDGGRQIIFSMNHPGGRISIPYVVPQNTRLILSRSGEEIISELAQPIAPL